MNPSFVLLFVSLGGILANSENVMAQSASTDKIDAALNRPAPAATTRGATRSWQPTLATTRRGLKPEGATRSYSTDFKPLTRDYVEVDVQTDPEARISLPDIQFELGTVKPLNQAAKVQLDALAASLLKAHPGSKFLIEGHTCPKGGSEINNPLSIARAEFVKDYLLLKGVGPDMIEFIGCGSAQAEIKLLTTASSEAELTACRTVMVHKKVPSVK